MSAPHGTDHRGAPDVRTDDPPPQPLAPSAATHPLTTLLRAAARRALPPVDGTVAACPAPSGPCAVAVAIGGLSMVAADVPRSG